MFRDYTVSSYTGLACTFSFLIREHGIEKVYGIVLEAAKNYSTGPLKDLRLSDALSQLAIAIASPGISEAMEGVPPAKKAWRKRSEARIKAFDKVLEVADSIKFQDLSLYSFLEIPESPLRLSPRYGYIVPEPISNIQSRLDELMLREEDDQSWYAFEKFVLSVFPGEIERQLELYDELVAIIKSGRQDVRYVKRYSPLSILKLRIGSAYKVAELSPKYENARLSLPKLRLSIKKFESALAAEFDSGRLWESARYEIEKGIPDELGILITYETIKAIKNTADTLDGENSKEY